MKTTMYSNEVRLDMIRFFGKQPLPTKKVIIIKKAQLAGLLNICY